uniref:non-specific serine/threonine protein kinase n=1 Tax=Nelumbo nucifera TaxID=4432 RepID=A0A822Y1J4_NELNU|nr:TPA_asm: hypothetical protein HUJ06_026590 [Nelumbo nucifera]
MLDDLVTEMKLEDLMKFTKNFDKDHIIGSGRSGTVYKATPDTDCFLAIKRFEDSEHLERQFRAELTTLGKVMRHRNLVPLLSFCMAEEQRLLVYEYMPNRTLYDWLHPMDQGKSKALEWPKRLRIGIGLARGLAWLHYNSDTRIIHRNLTSKSVLLDENFEPKISNFGFAMLLNWDEFQTNTSMISEAGDLDYVGLDYTQTPVPALKRDVYSFGIVLLELLTGKQPDQVTNAQGSFNGSLVEWIAHLSDKTSGIYSAIDKSLIGRGFDGEILQFLGVACNCVLSPPKERPKMFEVYKTLRAVGEGYEFIDNDDLLM